MFLLRPTKEVLQAVNNMSGTESFILFKKWIQDSAENTSNILKGASQDIAMRRAQGAAFVLDPLLVVLETHDELLKYVEVPEESPSEQMQ